MNFERTFNFLNLSENLVTVSSFHHLCFRIKMLPIFCTFWRTTCRIWRTDMGTNLMVAEKVDLQVHFIIYCQ